ncbi:MAG: sugar phosphate nucleotidyltransferase [Planctomycetota bacterium]
MRYSMIMAGGSGTRLWPMSRDGQPKQLIRFIHREDGSVASLLEIAAERMASLVPADKRYICTGERYRRQIRDALPGFDDAHILGEPQPRDTVNAVAFAATVFAKEHPGAVFAVLTADQLITPAEEFERAMDVGYRLVEEDPTRLVTFGITPTHPATGYGYIARGGPVRVSDQDLGAFGVERFVEKPTLEKAEAYLGSGRYFWNSGMFVFNARKFIELYEHYIPENREGMRRITDAWGTPGQQRTLDEVYPTLKKTSVDYGVMEPAVNAENASIVGVEMSARWLDVGSWPSYGETLDPDADGNRSVGLRLASHDSTNCIAIGDGDDPDHLVSLVGCEGLIVVRTGRATLVMPREQAEALKALHGTLESADR